MLVQTSEVRVPDTEAWCRTSALRGRGFAFSMHTSNGMATDWGILAPLVGYIARQSRSQMSIVLAGRGYVGTGACTTLLTAGDVVEMDQHRHDDEGYAGSPCEVLVVEWDHDGLFGDAWRGPPRVSRISRCDVARLRGLVARIATMAPEDWVIDVVRTLRATGLRAPPPTSIDENVPEQTVRLYRAFAETRERLPTMPSMGELADGVGISERHARRAIDSLQREYAMPLDGWRETIADMRMSAAQQLLSIPGMRGSRVAALSGFRSAVALSHAFTLRDAGTPGEMARALRQRWG